MLNYYLHFPYCMSHLHQVDNQNFVPLHRVLESYLSQYCQNIWVISELCSTLFVIMIFFIYFGDIHVLFLYAKFLFVTIFVTTCWLCQRLTAETEMAAKVTEQACKPGGYASSKLRPTHQIRV